MRTLLLPLLALFIAKNSICQDEQLFGGLLKTQGKLERTTGHLLVSGASWTKGCLSVSKFNNGDPIPVVSDKYEWKKASEEHKPVMMYVSKSNPNSGIYYNRYCLQDKRGIIPSGYRMPSDQDWKDLHDFVYNSKGWSDELYKEFLGGQLGYVNGEGDLVQYGTASLWWASAITVDPSNYDLMSAIGSVFICNKGERSIQKLTMVFKEDRKTTEQSGFPFSHGLQIKLIKDEPNSRISTFVFDNGDSLTGEFINGNVTGRGRYVASWGIMEGEYKNGTQEGPGVFWDKNGNKYTGNWVNGVMDGVFNMASISGGNKKLLYLAGKLIASEGEPKFDKLISMSDAMKKLYLLNNGEYMRQLSSGRIKGGSVGATLLYAYFNNNDGDFNVCNLGLNANNKAYTTNDCVRMTKVVQSGEKVYLTFEGPINYHKSNYSISTQFRPESLSFERKINYDGQTLISKTVELQIETTLSGSFLSFRVCIMDSEGRPDCGGFDPYGGSLNRY